MTNPTEGNRLLTLPIENVIADPGQPRKTFNAIQDQELMQSLDRSGQLVPITVYAENDRWVIVDGERRWRSLKALNRTSLEAKILTSKPSDSDRLIIQLSTNCQRSDIHPLDRLEAFKQLLRLTSWKATDLASNLSLSKPTVSRILSLDRFSDDEKLMFRNGAITTTEAYALARLSDEQRTAKLRPPPYSSDKESLTTDERKVLSTSVLTFQLGQSSIRIRGDAGESFESILLLLKHLLRECKRAKREGIDPKTLTQVLLDKSQSKECCNV